MKIKIYNIFRGVLIILIITFSKHVFALNSSAYLVANTAIKLFDFDKANDQLDLLEINVNETDLQNKLLTYVNLKFIFKANSVAEKIISLKEFNQEAWIVRITNAIIINDLDDINIFKEIKNKPEMNLINYIFFNPLGDLKSNNLIARSIFELVQASISENKNNTNYEFLLFYLSIANIIDPDFSEAYFYSAQIYQILENYSKAEFFYKKISSSHNLFIESQKNIAINKNKMGFQNDGINLLRDLISKDEQNLSLIVSLADLYRIQKNYQGAIKLYTKIINLKNNIFNEYWRIFYLRGICYERIQNWELAEKDFLFSIEIKPNSPQVLNYLAYGWLERDMNLEKATNMLKEAYQANPESYFIADSLAWAFFKNNKLTKAANLMEKVIVMAPGEAISLDHLGDIYFAMNRKREASFFWKQALDLAEPEDEISDKLKKKLEVYNAG
jgi:tetratricopeptide (TPR) repeat protein